VITKSKVYTDPIGVKHGLWPLRCPQRNLDFFFISSHDPVCFISKEFT
jgi:hypothetical protein